MYGTGGKGRSSKMPSQSETPVLKGTTSGSKYRVDDNGFLYVKDNSGKWINTGKKSKYKIPETVVDESTGLEVSPTEPEGGEPEMNGRRRTPRGMRGGGLGGMPPSGGSGGSGDVSGQGLGSLAGASRKRFGVGLGRMSAGVDYGMYNEEEEKARLAKIGRVKAPYMAGMSYLSAGGAGGGYSEEKAQKRLEEINRVKIPYAAGMNYISAGTYTGNRPISSLGDSGKNVDAFSSGMYKVSYGGKKAVQPQQPVSLDQQIEQLQQVQVRQAKIKQLQQLQEETGVPTQPMPKQELGGESPLGLEYPAPRHEMGALETLFGMRTSAPSTSAIYGGSTPTLRESGTPKRSASATEEFFGLRSGNGSQLNSPESADVNRSATANFFGLNKPKRYPATQLQMQTRPVNPQNQQSPMPLQPLVKLKKLPKSVKQKLKQIQNMPPQQQVPMPSELPPAPQFQPPKKPRSEMTAAELLFGNR
jgi:hypothetical protein